MKHNDYIHRLYFTYIHNRREHNFRACIISFFDRLSLQYLDSIFYTFISNNQLLRIVVKISNLQSKHFLVLRIILTCDKFYLFYPF